MASNTSSMAGVEGETQLPDWSSIRSLSPANQGETQLPDNLEGITSIEEKIGSFSEGEAMLFAAELGLKDTYRGITQLVGYNESETKHDQQVLYNLMENPEWGGKVKAMYIGGMILDPAGWLIPIAKARTVARAAWQGFKWGGVSGFFGYVDGDTQDRLLQAVGGAAGGTIVSGGLKGIQRAFTRGKPQPATVAPTADERAKQILGMAEDAYPGQAIKLSKVDDTSIKITGKDGETIFDWAAGKSAAELIDNPETAVKYFKGTDRIPLHQKVQQFLSQPYQTARKGYDKFFEDRVYKPVFQNPIPSIAGAAGFVAGQQAADALLRDQFESMEEQNHLQNGVFSQAMISSIGLASGIVSAIGTKKGMKTASGEKIADHFGRYFIDNFNVPSDYVKMKQNIGIHENSLETRWEEIVSTAKKLTQDEKYVLYYFFDGRLRMDQAAPALSKEAQELGPTAQKIIMETGQKMVDVGLLDPKVFNKNKDKYIHRTYLKHLTDTDKSVSDSIKKVKSDIGYIGDELKPRGFRKAINNKEIAAYKETHGDLLEILGPSSKNKNKTEIRVLLSYEQRQGLGEIEDAAWGLIQTGRVNLNDLSVQSFFRDVNDKYGFILQKELDTFLKKATNKKLTQADREYFSNQYKENKGRVYEKLSPEEQAKMVLVPPRFS